MRDNHQDDIQIQIIHSRVCEGLSASSTAYRHHRFPRHFHDHYSIILIEEGINEGFTEKVKYKVQAGGIIVINPGELHAGNSFENAYHQFKSLRVEADFLNTLYRKNHFIQKGDIYFQNHPIHQPALASQFRKIYAQLVNKSSKLQLSTTINQFFISLVKDYSNQAFAFNLESKNSPALERAKAFIQAHYQDNISLDDLSQHAYLSRFYLIRQFKKQYGLSPFAYLRNLRIEKAKQLLRGHFSISEIAHEVGFFDHSHFIRHFKKIEGTLPSNFR